MTKRHFYKKYSIAAIPLCGALVAFAFGSFARAAGQSPATASGSVWDGVFTADQAARGWREFQEHCSSCHGAELQGSAEAKALKGDRFWADWKESTVDYLFERISKSMPFSEDGSLAGTLTQQTYIDIVAHILSVNEFPAGPKELTKDSSVGVQIIRKEGPGELPSGTLVRVVGCLTKATDGSWRLIKAAAPVRNRPGTTASSAASSTGAPNREYVLKFALTPLDKFVGHRLAATGLLIGEGGKDGINLSSTTSLSATCE
ncbi:MAG TPA: cytochrome c [Terriglobia bacterium]|nr:cytochrome c [Terriglobia bacterium]